MPGYNQRGPLDQGPMTGGKGGLCNRAESPKDLNEPDEFAARFGRERGRRRCRQFCGGREVNQSNQENYQQITTTSKDTLQNRADLLEAELSSIKKEIQKLA